MATEKLCFLLFICSRVFVDMPRCEGRADGPCPDMRNDKTVQQTQGDLFLCEACDRARFPIQQAPSGRSGRSTKKKPVPDRHNERLVTSAGVGKSSRWQMQ